MKMTWTLAGKIGDAIHQWPIVHHWHKETGKPFDVWIDQGCGAPLVPLFQAQSGVEEVKLIPGIENYRCGGQPWHFNLEANEHQDRQVMHLGFRYFPDRQLTLFTLGTVPLKLKATQAEISATPCLVVPELPKANRLVLHGTAFTHGRVVPQFWKFLSGIRKDIEKQFGEIVFLGTPDEREMGCQTYGYKDFDDQGDFLKLASYINASECLIACGSSVAALGGALKIPTIRVHDPIGGFEKQLWSNLGPNQLNETEIGLRRAWPEFLKNLEAAWQTA